MKRFYTRLKKVLAGSLAFMMILGAFPVSETYADEADTSESSTQESTETVTTTVSENDSTLTYVLEGTALTAFSAGAKADGDEEKAGTDNYFTLIYSAKSKVDSSSKTFDDGYASTQRINFGGVVTTGKNAVKITTACDNATVKVWWVEGGDDSRQIGVLGSDGTEVTRTSDTLAKNAVCVSKLSLGNAGTYYLGSVINNNYIFKIEVTETAGTVEQPERADWDSVEAPSIEVTGNADGKITLSVSANVGYDGGDKVTVVMTDSEGTVLTTKTSSKEADTHTMEFTPDASGDYSFTATLSREECDDLLSETVTAEGFVLPLSAPTVKSLTNKGNGSVLVEWNAVKEATSYIVVVNGNETVTTEETKATITGLTIGEEAQISVIALRGENDKSEASAETTITVEDRVDRTWAFTVYGTSTDIKNNGYTGSINDGSVTVYSLSGKGKIVPNSTDGLSFYYTTVDPDTENFTIEADVTVDQWTLSNGQEGFGMMVADTIGTSGSTDTVWNNSIQNIVSKVEYYSDGENVTTDTTATKISMKLGVGALVRLGVTGDDAVNFKSSKTFLYADGTTAAVPENFTTETTTLETSCAGLEAGTYNIVGNCTAEPAGTNDNITTFHMSIQRNNTGYIVKYSDAEGNVIGEKLVYDTERNALTQIDPDNIYVGFFAARNAKITVTNMTFTTVSPEEDEKAEEREIEYVEPVYTIESASTANKEAYDLTFCANADGLAKVTDADGNVLYSDIAVTANEKAHFATTLSLGDNTYSVEFTPNADYQPGEYKKLSSYDTQTVSKTVTYKKIEGQYIYVASDGSADANGAKKTPVDIYTAVKYAAPGQTIVLAGGTYSLTSTIKVEPGIDGTEGALIYMIADPKAENRPVFDFGGNCAGMVLGGDYWYFKGFDVTNSQNAQKGIQLSGSNNTLDDIRAYRNGNTGIQISRYSSKDSKDEWPANNLVLNCTSYLNADAGYEDADGFAAKLTVGSGNVFNGCVSAFNADDGWDLYAKVETGSIGAVTIENCVAFCNGYVLDADGNKVDAGNGNGFKMGGESLSGYHVLKNSVAFANKAKGIDSNSCPDDQVYTSTSFDNESYNVAFYTNNAVNTDFLADGIISYKKSNDTAEQLKLKGTQDETKVYGTNNYYTYGKENSYNSENTLVSDDWFESLDSETVISKAISQMLDNTFGLVNTGLEVGITRNTDNTIDMNGFLVLTESAPENSGARISGTASMVVEIKEEVPTPAPSEKERVEEKVKQTITVVEKTVKKVAETVKSNAISKTEKVVKVTKTIVKAVKSIFGKWFR